LSPLRRAVPLPKPHWRRGGRWRGTRRAPPAGQGASGGAAEGPGWPYCCVVARGSKAFAHFPSFSAVAVSTCCGYQLEFPDCSAWRECLALPTAKQWLLPHNNNYCSASPGSRRFYEPETKKKRILMLSVVEVYSDWRRIQQRAREAAPNRRGGSKGLYSPSFREAEFSETRIHPPAYPYRFAGVCGLIAEYYA
jgi:hypothetical protein